MPESPAIKTLDLSRSFGSTIALDRLNITVERGEIFGFLGHNGAGKTTTIRLLNGVLLPSSGSCEVLELDPTSHGPLLRAKTGVLTETPALDDRLTAYEVLHMQGELFNMPREQLPDRIEELLTSFDLLGRSRDRIGGYSRGMKQRLALARALITDPQVLFLDEPTAGLDPVASRLVHDMILALAADAGRTVFMTTHNMGEAARLCSRVAVLESGHLVAMGSPAELTARMQTQGNVTIEVDPAQVGDAVGALSDEFDHRVVGGGVLSVEVTAREDIPRIASGLVEAGVRVYRIDSEEPTLEDFYLSIHRGGRMQ